MNNKEEILKREMLPEYAVDSDILKVTTKRLEELGRDLQERFTALSKMRERSELERGWAEDFKSYHLQEPERDLPYPGAPNLRCVLPRIGVDAAHANNMYAFCGQDNYVKVEPDYISEDFVTVADKGAKYLTYQLRYEANFYEVLDDADRKAHMYGIAYLEPRYCKEEADEIYRTTEDVEEAVIDPLTGVMETRTKKVTKTKKRTRTIFDGVKIDSIPVENLLVSPFVRDLEEAVKKDVVFKKAPGIRLKDIKARSNGDEPFYIKKQVEKLATQVRARVSKLQEARRDLDGFELERLCDKEAVDLAEAYLWEDVDGDDKPEQIKVTFDPATGTVIRISLAPCRIVELRPRPVDERFHGESIRRASDSICKEWESIHNGRVIKNDWANNTFFFYNAGGRFNPQEITLTPGHGYPVDNPSDVYFPQITGPGPSGYQEESLLMSYWERIIGISENMQGVGGSRDVTATENLNLNQKASIRQSNQVARVATALERLLAHIWDLNRECAPDEKEYFVVGMGKGVRVFDKITRDDYKSQVKFKLQIATINDQQLYRDTWLMAFRMFRQDPLIMAHPAASYELFKNTLRGMGISLDIPKPPQANTLSPSEEHELMLRGDEVEPEPGEDYDEHLQRHMAWLKTDKFKEWSEEAKARLLEHIDKTKILKQTLEASNLNKSGIYEPPMQGKGVGMPGLTSSRNPNQLFNNMRVGESGASATENNRNGGYGA